MILLPHINHEEEQHPYASCKQEDGEITPYGSHRSHMFMPLQSAIFFFVFSLRYLRHLTQTKLITMSMHYSFSTIYIVQQR